MIKGLQKLTLLDYPGKLACTVFLGGCNFRCPFCHNASLVLGGESGNIDNESFFNFLDARRGRLEGVCVSGGEPTLQPNIADFLREIKARGMLIKLDTNGSNPNVIEKLINERLVDYIAMDIKNSPESYLKTMSSEEMPLRDFDIEKIKRSVDILKKGLVDYEFRTTLVRELHSEEDIVKIGEWLEGDSKYYLQTYRESEGVISPIYSAFTAEETKTMLEMVKKYLPNAEIR